MACSVLCDPHKRNRCEWMERSPVYHLASYKRFSSLSIGFISICSQNGISKGNWIRKKKKTDGKKTTKQPRSVCIASTEESKKKRKRKKGVGKKGKRDNCVRKRNCESNWIYLECFMVLGTLAEQWCLLFFFSFTCKCHTYLLLLCYSLLFTQTIILWTALYNPVQAPISHECECEIVCAEEFERNK